MTARDGDIEFILKDLCTVVITVQKTGYANLARKFEITNGLLLSAINKQVFLTVPMVKDIDGDL